MIIKFILKESRKFTVVYLYVVKIKYQNGKRHRCRDENSYRKIVF